MQCPVLSSTYLPETALTKDTLRSSSFLLSPTFKIQLSPSLTTLFCTTSAIVSVEQK